MTILRWFGVACVAAVATAPADAHPAATTRLVSCGAADCVLIRGHRGSPEAAVRINERAVAASGGTSWQVRLPVATIRDWSAPFARTLRIAVIDPAGTAERDDAVRLPIGLLGAKMELASLVVRAR